MSRKDTGSFAIVYLRPDGWWCAGDGFVSEMDAIGAGDDHDWRGTDWKVVATSELVATLCAEALEDWEATDLRQQGGGVSPRLLDLFCGAGGAGMGYARAGFEVVGVDIDPQPHYPFEFHQADATTFPLDGFDAIHASPPCQRWAQGHNPNHDSYPDLIGVMRERLEASGVPYVIENVIRAPLLPHAVMICGAAVGCLTEQFQLHRHRKFEANFPLVGADCPGKVRPWTMTVTGTGTPSGLFYKLGRALTTAEKREMMEMPGCNSHEMAEAVPPAYTEFIGRQLIEMLADNKEGE